jgi:hypothetical protein
MDANELKEAIRSWCQTEFELGLLQRVARGEPSSFNRRAVAFQKLHVEEARMRWADWLVGYIGWSEDTGGDFNEQVCLIARWAESAGLAYRLAGFRGRPLEDEFTVNVGWDSAIWRLGWLNPDETLRRARLHEEFYAGPTLEKALDLIGWPPRRSGRPSSCGR